MLNAARPFICTDLEQLSVVWLNNTEDEVKHTGIKDALMESKSRLFGSDNKAIASVQQEARKKGPS